MVFYDEKLEKIGVNFLGVGEKVSESVDYKIVFYR